jgi:hypothetical protein
LPFFDQTLLDQHLRDLHRILSSALADVVGGQEQVEPMLDREILANAADVCEVAAAHLDWLRELELLDIVYELDAGRLR